MIFMRDFYLEAVESNYARLQEEYERESYLACVCPKCSENEDDFVKCSECEVYKCPNCDFKNANDSFVCNECKEYL